MEKEIIKHIQLYAQKYKKVKLFMLFGSRAQNKAREDSDWDFAYIADNDFDPSSLYTDLVLALETDQVDLVDLSKASGLLRFRVAQDGIVLFENTLDHDQHQSQYQKFWIEAVNFWCDVSSLIKEEYDSLLEDIG